MNLPWIRPTLALAAALTLAPAAAHAGTLVYVDGGRAYVANDDGSRARPVSPSGNWAWPSESDRGTIAVAGGDERVNPGGTTESSGASEIFAFDQQGRPLLSAPVHTPGSVSGPTAPTYVNHFRISPDGSTVAYDVLGCCGMSGASTFVSPLQSGSNDWSDFQDDYLDPVWLDASNDPYVKDADALGLTHNGASVWGNAEYAVYHASNRNTGNGMGWGSDAAIPDGWDYEVAYNRPLTTIALFLDDAGNSGGTPQHVQIHLENLSFAQDGSNTDDCTITLPAAQYAAPHDLAQASPAFSADGRTLAWAQHDGIYEADVANPADCNTVGGSVHRIVAGGQMPSFGAAPLSPAPVAKPVAHFRLPARARTGHAVAFTGSASRANAKRIVRWRWHFGDGATATGRHVKHTYHRPGRYTVRLTVTDNHGQSGSSHARITITR